MSHSNWAAEELAKIDAAAAAIREKDAREFRVALVLGSGLGAFGDAVENATVIPYGELPGFPESGVVGHAGRLVIGEVKGIPVAVMQGRVHMYEGHPLADVVRPVRALGRLGAKAVVITNAAGGINAGFDAGDLMLITDHLNLTGRNPLTGPNIAELGPRFPDMGDAWTQALRPAMRKAARAADVDLKQGVYAWMPGPNYEAPAEVRMLRTMGADAVGMSTVPEVIALRHMGVPCTGVSCISNLAAGISPTALTHDEVKETADRVAADFVRLLEAAVPTLDGAVGAGA